ncbi:MAG: 3-methyl-2-oxobutanoate hydroxymethyltransferase [Serratia liquefaciens]|nr:3-methyl-2-oxobutanoate hydroxymethyltransferase [Serratia liquefaciens]
MKPTTVTHLRQWKQEQRKFASLTAYDASFAKLFEEQGVKVLLVGDSLGMTLQGHDSTLPVTVADVAYHTRAVRRGAPACLLLADMPFMSYATPQSACANAAELMQAGANMVKLEGGSWGYKVQGRDELAAKQLLEDAKNLELAGMQLLVLECVPTELARKITEELTIPVIGIGAGNATDGQILVMHDAFGITGGHTPKFAKNFLAQSGDIRSAVQHYIQDVEQGIYPAEEHSFN